MGRVQTVSTAGIVASERVVFWNSGAQEIGTIGAICAKPLTSSFHAEAATRQLGPMLVFALKSTPHVVRYARPSFDGQDIVRLRYQRSGESIIEQAGQRTTLREGDWTIIDGSLPHSMMNTADASQLSLHLPRSVLSERDYHLVRNIVGAMRAEGRVSKLLVDCLKFSIEELQETSSDVEQDLGLSIFEMFRVVISDVASAQASSSTRDVLEQRVREYINRNLCDCDLSVEAIAQAMGCSTRYLHKVFQGKESISGLIWSQRLDRCRRELMTAHSAGTTLTELAYEYGFSSSAHFSRSFKERFGIAPSAFRMRSNAPGGERGAE